jgi:hypothetical protein
MCDLELARFAGSTQTKGQALLKSRELAEEFTPKYTAPEVILYKEMMTDRERELGSLGANHNGDDSTSTLGDPTISSANTNLTTTNTAPNSTLINTTSNHNPRRTLKRYKIFNASVIARTSLDIYQVGLILAELFAEPVPIPVLPTYMNLDTEYSYGEEMFLQMHSPKTHCGYYPYLSDLVAKMTSWDPFDRPTITETIKAFKNATTKAGWYIPSPSSSHLTTIESSSPSLSLPLTPPYNITGNNNTTASNTPMLSLTPTTSQSTSSSSSSSSTRQGGILKYTKPLIVRSDPIEEGKATSTGGLYEGTNLNQSQGSDNFQVAPDTPLYKGKDRKKRLSFADSLVEEIMETSDSRQNIDEKKVNSTTTATVCTANTNNNNNYYNNITNEHEQPYQPEKMKKSLSGLAKIPWKAIESSWTKALELATLSNYEMKSSSSFTNLLLVESKRAKVRHPLPDSGIKIYEELFKINKNLLLTLYVTNLRAHNLEEKEREEENRKQINAGNSSIPTGQQQQQPQQKQGTASHTQGNGQLQGNITIATICNFLRYQCEPTQRDIINLEELRRMILTKDQMVQDIQEKKNQIVFVEKEMAEEKGSGENMLDDNDDNNNMRKKNNKNNNSNTFFSSNTAPTSSSGSGRGSGGNSKHNRGRSNGSNGGGLRKTMSHDKLLEFEKNHLNSVARLIIEWLAIPSEVPLDALNQCEQLLAFKCPIEPLSPISSTKSHSDSNRSMSTTLSDFSETGTTTTGVLKSGRGTAGDRKGTKTKERGRLLKVKEEREKEKEEKETEISNNESQRKKENNDDNLYSRPDRSPSGLGLLLTGTVVGVGCMLLVWVNRTKSSRLI